jgi:hypothetical protein
MWSPRSVNLGKRVHRERQGINIPFVVCHHLKPKRIEIRVLVNPFPNLLVVSVKYVRAVGVNVYAVLLLGIAVATDMLSFLYDGY